MGNSGTNPPKDASESYFVADEDFGRLDTLHEITASGQVIAVSIPTTRVVGSVNDEGFLLFGEAAIERGTLARHLVLTIRANLSAVEGGPFLLGDGVEVEVVLHKGTDRERSLGYLDGVIGQGWEEWEFYVSVRDVRFPRDPSLDDPPVERPVPRPNEISFVFTGPAIAFNPMTLEVDWLTLEPEVQPGLAWRPVLLVHGWSSDASEMGPGTAWAEGLALRDVGFHAVDLNPFGAIRDNGAAIAVAVAALKTRFGVQRVNVVGHSKGGIDTRQYVQTHNDVETLIMLATPNGGSFKADKAVLASVAFSAIPISSFLKLDWMTTLGMATYNRDCVENSKVAYVTAAGAYDSLVALALEPKYGPNDEVVSVASVGALDYSTDHPYDTSIFDPESQGVCADELLSHHSCLRYYSRIVNDLFLRYFAVLTAPLPAPLPAPRGVEGTAGPVREEVAADLQSVASDAAMVPGDGVTQAHAVLIDGGDTAEFLVFVESDLVRLELVSPSGTRIDATTPLTDPAVVHAPLLDAGPFFDTSYQIQAPETGNWTLEVTGTGVPSPDSAYGVTALVQLPPGTGVALAAAVDREQYVVGEAVTITATVTSDGVLVTDATVTGTVVHPDGVTTTEVVLVDDGRGEGTYRGVFAATTLSGLYDLVVAAEGTAPAFTRQQLLLVSVVPSATTFSGVITDHGVDADGDGLYEQLVVEVGVEVDVAAAYRVFGTLVDGAGTALQQLRVEQHLEPGPQTVSLAFDGAVLFAFGRDGPYLLEDLVLEDVATLTGLAVGPAYTTAAYAHTDFQRPPLLLTGNTADHGEHDVHMERMPYENLVIEVEVDILAGVTLEATAKLYADDGSFIWTGRVFSSFAPGLGVLAFRFAAHDIFRSGQPGPYTLRLLSMWGTSTDGAPVSLRAPGVVAVTQPYRLEDFAPSPRFTVGGTVTGLVGTDLVVSESLSFLDLHLGNGPFAFTVPMDATRYDVRVTKQPANPSQLCTVRNATGTIGDADVTDVVVECAPPPVQAGLDTDFGSGGTVTADRVGPSGPSAIALQSDGGIVLVGGRTLSRFTAAGAPDPTFGSGGEATVMFSGSIFDQARGVAVQPDGRIVVAGHTRADFALERHLADGSMDLDFGTGGAVITDFTAGIDQGQAVLIQPDGKIVVAGHASSGPPVPANLFAVARYTASGNLDTGFGDGGKVTTRIAGGSDLGKAALLQPDGKIVVTGRVAVTGGDNPDFGVVRYTAAGAHDPDFGAEGIVRTDFGLDGWVEPTDLALQSDGMLVVIGQVLVGAGPNPFAMARFDSAGAVDTRFGAAGLVTTPFGPRDAVARAVAVQADDKIVVAGYTGDGTQDVFTIARYTADGVLDPSFGTGGTLTVDYFGGSDRAECVAVQADNKIVVAGSAVNVRTGKQALARILP